MSDRIQIVAVGKMKEKYFNETVSEYVKRLTRFCKLTVIEVGDERNPKEQNKAQELIALSRESSRILQHIKNTTVVAMDVKGARVSSERFAEIIKSYYESNKSVSFVIGGSMGLGKDILDKSDLKLSMSDMTFPHQLARVILIEQLYRAFKIIANEVYHK